MSISRTKEVNVQVLIYLLKSHGVRKVVGSPGTTNVAFLGSIQNDPYFTVYSSVDERSAAYIACGLAEESGEPVALSCTGATASRNYVSGLTEAYYRKLPVIAITSTQPPSKVGHNVAQVIDRSCIQNDIVKLSVSLPIVKDSDDLWDCEIKVNKALLESKRAGGGPVHINLPTSYTLPFENKELPKYRLIERINSHDDFPELKGKVAIFVGAHKRFTSSEIVSLEKFCSANDAVVFCDHTSGYVGKYRVTFALAASQEMMDKSKFQADTLIHIGEISGDYHTLNMSGKIVWRVSEDGEIRDTFKKLRYVFEMPEQAFFDYYSKEKITKATTNYLDSCKSCLSDIRNKIPELPFSNIWLASKLSSEIPVNSVLHFGILNSLRSWNFFDVDPTISTASNVGGFGIDGNLSSLIGASLNSPDSLYYCVLGDLAFFYDMNSLGNRHVGNNIRILLINNGKGTEFRQYNHHASYFGDSADELIAASEHYGNKSPKLVKQYADGLGFEYFSSSNKKEFELVYKRFVKPELTDKPMIFEVFTDSEDESNALKIMQSIIQDNKLVVKNKTKKLLGPGGINIIKKMMRS